MELREFVSETLRNIIYGVVMAQEHAKKQEDLTMVNPADLALTTSNDFLADIHGKGVSIICFDVAVTAAEGDGYEAGAGIFVGAVGIGTRGKYETQSSALNKITFAIPVYLPHTSTPKLPPELLTAKRR